MPPPVPLNFPLENFMFKFTSHPMGIPDTLASTTVHFFERRRLRARIPPQRRNDNTLIQIEPQRIA